MELLNTSLLPSCFPQYLSVSECQHVRNALSDEKGYFPHFQFPVQDFFAFVLDFKSELEYNHAVNSFLLFCPLSQSSKSVNDLIIHNPLEIFQLLSRTPLSHPLNLHIATHISLPFLLLMAAFSRSVCATRRCRNLHLKRNFLQMVLAS